MAKAKKPDDIMKAYGEVIYNASSIVDNPPRIISVSPKVDIALGGGVPEGSLFIMTGPEKIGKTITALQFARNAQDVPTEKNEKRKVYFGNVEGRLRKRDLEGIVGLVHDDPEVFKVVGSVRGKILSGEDYLSIFDNIIYNETDRVCIIDSFSALASESELVNDINKAQVAPMHKHLAKFTRRFANVLPINKNTLVGITHLMANINAFGGKSKVEKSGTALKYAQDVKLYASHRTFPPAFIPNDGASPIGQEIHWKVENSAIGPPGQKFSSYVKFGRGIWNEYEIAELCVDFGIARGSSWLEIDGLDKKIQGKCNLAIYLEENPEAYKDFKAKIYEMVGLETYV